MLLCTQLKCQFFVDLRAQTDLSKFSALTIYLTFLFHICSKQLVLKKHLSNCNAIEKFKRTL